MTGRCSALMISAALALATLGCSSTTAAGENSGARSISAAQTFAMKPGESVSLDGRGQLKYVGVKSDSRCPPERQCVWAGDAEVTFEWTATGAGAESFGLHTGFADKASKPVGGHKLALVSLARGANPEAQLKLDSAP